VAPGRALGQQVTTMSRFMAWYIFWSIAFGVMAEYKLLHPDSTPLRSIAAGVVWPVGAGFLLEHHIYHTLSK
jgi:hypothetical protein